MIDSTVNALTCKRAYHLKLSATDNKVLHVGGNSTLAYTTTTTNTPVVNSDSIAVEPSVTLTGSTFSTIEKNAIVKCENAFTFHPTVEAAVAAAAEDETVKLLADCTLTGAATAAKTGVTIDVNGNSLDLAGKTLTVSGVTTVYGGKIIDTVGGGLLTGEKANSSFGAANGGYLPLYDNAKRGYSFYTYTAKKAVQGSNTAAKFWFDVDFDENAAYSLLGDNMTLGGSLTLGGGKRWQPGQPEV